MNLADARQYLAHKLSPKTHPAPYRPDVPDGTDQRRVLNVLETVDTPKTSQEITDLIPRDEANVLFIEIDLRFLREAGYVTREHTTGVDRYSITKRGIAALNS